MTPGVMLSSVSRKTVWLAVAAVGAGLLVDVRVGSGVACGAMLGLLLLHSQAIIIDLCSDRKVKRWRRRLGYLWLLKYPALLTGLYCLVNFVPISVPAFAVGLGLIPAALLIHGLAAG